MTNGLVNTVKSFTFLLNIIIFHLCRSHNGHNWMSEFYTQSYSRTGPYAVGLLFGYYMYKYKDISRINGRKLPWFIVSCGWFISTTTALVLVFGLAVFYISATGAILYAAFARAVWGAVIGWIIFACHTGYGGKFSNAYTTTNYNVTRLI